MKLEERKAVNLRARTTDELREELLQLKKESFNLRFQKANAQVTDTARAKWIKRKIATINTVLAETQHKAG